MSIQYLILNLLILKNVTKFVNYKRKFKITRFKTENHNKEISWSGILVRREDEYITRRIRQMKIERKH